ncbi:MAG TPA: hypothetical protein VF720_16355 [Candidatus Eisenbacteria bacterium]
MTPPPFHQRHRGPILAAFLITAAAVLFMADPVRRALLPASAVIVEFNHPAATSTARVRIVEDRGPVRIGHADGSPVEEIVLDGGRIAIDVKGEPRNFKIDIPRATPFMELRVSDRTVFQRKGSVVTTIWPIDSDSTWLVPLTP